MLWHCPNHQAPPPAVAALSWRDVYDRPPAPPTGHRWECQCRFSNWEELHSYDMSKCLWYQRSLHEYLLLFYVTGKKSCPPCWPVHLSRLKSHSGTVLSSLCPVHTCKIVTVCHIQDGLFPTTQSTIASTSYLYCSSSRPLSTPV